MRTGAQYIESLRDGRQVIIDGEVVKDIPSHPAFAGVVQSAAKLYDYYAANQDVMTFKSPSSGKPVWYCHVIPKSVEDLRKRRIALTKSSEQTFGHMGRSPEHVASFIAAFASNPDVFARGKPQFAENVKRFHEKIREEHSYVSYVIIPPQVDRTKTASEQANSHIPAGVLKEVEGGIIVRGAQMLGTGAAISDYLFLSCIQPLKPGDEDYALSIVLPINAKGLKFYARRGYASNQPSVYDYPLSTRFDESDALVVLDDVFVPWEHVFVYRDVNLTRAQWFETGAHILGNTQAQIRLTTKVKFLLGVARKLAATTGIEKIPSVMWDLGEMASWAAIVEAMVLAAENTAITKPNGVTIPNPRFLYGTMGLQAQLYPRMIQILRELAGGGVLQVPSSVNEFKNPEMAKDLERYVQSPGVPAEEKVKLLKLAWDLVGSEFAGRHQQYEMFYAGAPFVAKNYSFMNYGFKEATDLVEQCLKGYDMDTEIQVQEQKSTGAKRLSAPAKAPALAP
jgi:4-hydroxyphenylacetate 3-monooxygenase